jgi:hypothetical protein
LLQAKEEPPGPAANVAWQPDYDQRAGNTQGQAPPGHQAAYLHQWAPTEPQSAYSLQHTYEQHPAAAVQQPVYQQQLPAASPGYSQAGFQQQHATPGFQQQHATPGFQQQHATPGFQQQHATPGFQQQHARPVHQPGYQQQPAAPNAQPTYQRQTSGYGQQKYDPTIQQGVEQMQAHTASGAYAPRYAVPAPAILGDRGSQGPSGTQADTGVGTRLSHQAAQPLPGSHPPRFGTGAHNLNSLDHDAGEGELEWPHGRCSDALELEDQPDTVADDQEANQELEAMQIAAMKAEAAERAAMMAPTDPYADAGRGRAPDHAPMDKHPRAPSFALIAAQSTPVATPAFEKTAPRDGYLRQCEGAAGEHRQPQGYSISVDAAQHYAGYAQNAHDIAAARQAALSER